MTAENILRVQYFPAIYIGAMGTSQSSQNGPSVGDSQGSVNNTATPARQSTFEQIAKNASHTAGDLANTFAQAAGNAAGTAAASAMAAKLGAYEMYKGEVARKGGVTGGGGGCGCFGGAATDETKNSAQRDLREYEASLASKAKDSVVRQLAGALKSVGIDLNPDADLAEIVAAMKAKLPNPRNGTTFSSDAKQQETVCKSIATALNNEFTPGATRASQKLIDTSLGPVEVCRLVSEWAQSFGQGVNTEFLSVHASVRNALKSIGVLDEILRKLSDKVRDDISKDERLSTKLYPFLETIDRAQAERTRQEGVLENLLAVQLAPAAKLLEIAMREGSENNALLKRINLRPGTSEFADLLASTVSGLGSIASVAEKANAALKRAGISVRQYLDSSSLADLDRKIQDAGKTGSDLESMAKMIKARNFLHETFDRYHDDTKFKAALEAAASARDSSRDNAASDSVTGSGERRGGDDDDDDNSKLSVTQRRLRSATSSRTVVIRDFATSISKLYEELLRAVSAIGPKLGKEIPISEKTDFLRDALSRLRDAREDSRRIELALIGRVATAESRERKERFVNSLRMIANACRAIMELSMYQGTSSYFAAIKDVIERIDKTIDRYSDALLGADPSRSSIGLSKPDVSGSGEDDAVLGGAGELDLLPELASSGESLKEALNSFVYFYYVAKVRENLARTAGELDQYGEKYTDLLGDAVANRIVKLQTEQEKVNTYISAAIADIKAGTATLPVQAALTSQLENTKSTLGAEFKVKDQLYRALQALDLYLKKFTAAITKNPDAVRDIKKTLDGTEVIAKWFNESTGDNICRAFEKLWIGEDMDIISRRTANTNEYKDQDHYYESINSFMGGCPLLGGMSASNAAEVAKISDIRKHIDAACDTYQALKNLINTFARVGDEFDKKNLRDQIFMSPSQIYRTLIQYLKQSAMSVALCPQSIGTIQNVILQNAIDVAAATVSDTAGAQAAARNSNGVSQQNIFPRDSAAAPTDCQLNANELHFTMVDHVAYKGNFETENKYFALIIRAMSAKILTTLGVYDMFERVTPINQLTPTRMIVGGAGVSGVAIIPEATELYFRLPRLAEFYLELFAWDETKMYNERRIGLIADLEGTFADLVQFIFIRASSAATGDYTDYELRELIGIINDIYLTYRARDSDRCIYAAMNGFVSEINRRYGVVRKADYDSYAKLLKETSTIIPDTESNDTNFSILPGENSADYTRNRAPSDRLLAGAYAGTSGAKLFNSNRTLDTAEDSEVKLLKEFRTKLDTMLTPNKAGNKLPSFGVYIKQAEAEIRKAASDDVKFGIVSRIIQSGTLIGSDSNKLLMFHETVVLGLNTLGVLTAIVQNLHDYAKKHNIANLITTTRHKIIDAVVDNTVSHFDQNPNYQAFMLDAGIDEHEYAIRAEGNYVATMIGINPAFNTFTSYAASIIYGIRGFEYVWRTAKNEFGHLDSKSFDGDVDEYINLLGKYGAYLTIDLPTELRNLVENLFAATSLTSGLIVLKFVSGPSGKTIRVSFDKLRDVAEQLLADVKQFFEVLRPYIDVEVANRYESSKSGTATNSGSIYWIQEKLIDKFFRKQSNSTGVIADGLMIDEISKNLSESYTAMIAPFEHTLFDECTQADYGTYHDLAEAIHLRALVLRQANNLQTTVTTLDTAILQGNPQVPPTAQNAGNYMADFTAAFKTMLKKQKKHVQTYGPMISGLVYYDNTQVDSGVLVDMKPYATTSLGDLIRRKKKPAMAMAAGTDDSIPTVVDNVGAPVLGLANVPMPADYIAGLYSMNRERQTLVNRSLLFGFNSMLAQYLLTFTDTAGGMRIYLNLINSYANGIASTSVMNPTSSAFPDIGDATAVSFGTRGAPRPTAILLQSLAFILQRMLRDVGQSNQLPDYLVTTLTDVPMYMKESMRANLPLFVQYFHTLVQKAEFIKQLIQKTDIDLTHPTLGMHNPNNNRISANGVVNAQFNAMGNYTVKQDMLPLFVLNAAQVSSEDKKHELLACIDAISNHAFSVMSAAGECYRELGDSPVLFQTGEGSIEQYKSRYNLFPMMPLSLVSWHLRDIELDPFGGTSSAAAAIDTRMNIYVNHTQLSSDQVRGYAVIDSKLIPGVHPGSSPLFKILYGSRGILTNTGALTYDSIPGARAILDMYNGTVSAKDQIDDKKYLSFCASIVGVVQFAVTVRNIRPIFAKSQIVSAVQITDAATGIRTNLDAKPNCTYALVDSDPQKDETRARVVLSVVESSAQDDEVHNIADLVSGDDSNASGTTRSEELARNIIDMNIIPINVHALMRDIPLANLYNYAHTFDQMVALMLGADQKEIINPNTMDSKAMFVRLIRDPYTHVGANQYGSSGHTHMSNSPIQRIFRGDNTLGMGRPKFLSDQIYNKCLFGSIYPSAAFYDEAGPNVGAGYGRGNSLIEGAIVHARSLLDEIFGNYINAFAPPDVQKATSIDNITTIGAKITKLRSEPLLSARFRKLSALLSAEYAIIAPKLVNSYADLGSVNTSFAHIRSRVLLLMRSSLRIPTADWRSIFGQLHIFDNAQSAQLNGQQTIDTMGTNLGIYDNHMQINTVVEYFDLITNRLLSTWNPLQQGAGVNALDQQGNQLNANDQITQLDFDNFVDTRMFVNLSTDLETMEQMFKDRTNPDQYYAGRSVLTYLKNDPSTGQAKVVTVYPPVPNISVLDFSSQGHIRFNTAFVRNIFFITNVLRVIRLKLNRELTQSRNLLVSSHAAVAPGLTEYGFDPYLPNQIANSTTMMNEAQFGAEDTII